MTFCDKQKYSQKDANSILNNIKRSKRLRKNKTPQRSYFCSICNAYHLTSIETLIPEKSIKKKLYERKQHIRASLEIQRDVDSIQYDG
jgi:hypothetical protein